MKTWKVGDGKGDQVSEAELQETVIAWPQWQGESASQAEICGVLDCVYRSVT
jgi:hypothetical protein